MNDSLLLTFAEYQEAALRTVNPDVKGDQLLLNAILGLVGEAGELADFLKKVLFQGHDFDWFKFVDEAGDVLWYLAVLSEALDIDLDDIADYNIEKLQKRYPNGFTPEASIRRIN